LPTGPAAVSRSTEQKFNVDDIAPREFKGPVERIKKGLFIIYTGHGKGKSTAAFGAVFRSLGRGYKAAIVQFIKGPWVSGEIKALEKFGDRVHFDSVGDGFTWDTKDLAKDVAAAQAGWEKCKILLSAARHDVYLFDELLYVLKYNFLNAADVLSDLERLKPPNAHVILTGRDAPAEFIDRADLVTEMREIKHPYRQGIVAQPGIDY
jgi:cob(I)alamin adenosyltransferase